MNDICRRGHAYDLDNTGIRSDGRRFCRTCTTASRIGARPRQDADHVAVERAVAGDAPAVMNIAERVQATAILTGRGHSTADIARMLKIAERVVTRYRAEIRKVAV